MADLKVRRALLVAIDRRALVKKLCEGMLSVAATWINPLDSTWTSSPCHLIRTGQEAAGGGRPDAARAGFCRSANGDRLSL